MSWTTSTLVNPSGAAAAVAPADQPSAASAVARRRAPWALWGVVAGAAGFVATVLSDPGSSVSDADYGTGSAIVDKLESGPYHVGVVAGFVCVAALLVTAAGWRRWAARTAPDSLAARVVSMAMIASAGAMMLGYGLKGTMAVYLPGGMDHGWMSQEGLYSVFMFLDLGAWMVWWGGVVAALAAVWLAFRERLLPRWIGAVSVVFAALPLGYLTLTGLPGMAAVTSIWLVVVSIGMVFSRRATTA